MSAHLADPFVEPTLRKRALITGASSGMGEAIARAFSKAGFDVALVARSADKLLALAQELTSLGGRAQHFVIDLSKIETVKAELVAAIAQFGPIDVLINNAGMGYTGSLADMPLADWQQVITLNVTSVFQAVQAALPQLRQSDSGLIINIASIAARQAFPNWGAYGVSKAALVALSGAIAAEESANGVRVVTVSPGAVNTPIWDAPSVQTAVASFDRTAMMSPATVAQTVLHTALLPPSAVISHLTITPAQGAL
ncbi:MAG: SDR family oxidoreductase [Cyanobacteria bacterium J06627_28]